MGKNFKKQLNNDGFTLVEMLVAMAIFVMVVLMVTDVFLIGLGNTARIFGSQAIQEDGRFILESVSKEIRMSKINGLGGSIYSSLPNGFSGPYYTLNITNANGQDVEYYFDSADKKMSRSGTVLSSDDVEVEGRFYLTKNGVMQPRITVTLKLVNKTSRAGGQAIVNLQTSVSSRRYAP